MTAQAKKAPEQTDSEEGILIELDHQVMHQTSLLMVDAIEGFVKPIYNVLPAQYRASLWLGLFSGLTAVICGQEQNNKKLREYVYKQMENASSVLKDVETYDAMSKLMDGMFDSQEGGGVH